MEKVQEILQKLEVVPEIMKELGDLKQELGENRDDFLLLKRSYQSLLVQERMRSDELREAREALVTKLGAVEKRSTGDVSKLVEEHKVTISSAIKFVQEEKDKLLKKVLELENQVGFKRQLQSEIKELKGQLQAQKEVESETKKKLEELKLELVDKIEDLDFLNDSYQTLAVKALLCNDELQDVHRALIEGLIKTQSGRATTIGIKRMGELNEKPFHKACKLRYPKDDIDFKSAQISSMWQEEIKKPAWHPFKRMKIDGKDKEVIDDEDERLQSLKEELGEDVYESVTTALLEVEEYNPSGRFIVPVLWNFREKRKAAPREVVEYIFNQLKTYKRKR